MKKYISQLDVYAEKATANLTQQDYLKQGFELAKEKMLEELKSLEKNNESFYDSIQGRANMAFLWDLQLAIQNLGDNPGENSER